MIVVALTLALLLAAPSALGVTAAQRGVFRIPPEPASVPTRLVSGHVFDAANGAALPRARVTVRSPAGVFEPVLTDDRGRFDISVPVAGEFALRIGKSGYATAYVPGPGQRQDRELQVGLALGAAVIGRVIDRSGMPGIAVAVTARRESGEAADTPMQFVADTDDRGVFRIGGLPAGRYSVVVAQGSSAMLPRLPGDLQALEARLERESPASAPLSTARTVDLRHGEEAESIDLVLRTNVTPACGATVRISGAANESGRAAIRGRVVDELGRPFACAIVSLTRPGAGPRAATTTDTQGRFEIDSLQAGSYTLVAGRATSVLTSQERTVGQSISLREAQRIDDVRIVVSRLGTITGAVVDEYGEPVHGASVQALLLQRNDRGGTDADMVMVRVTDDRGMFRLFDLYPGTYVVTASADAAISSAASLAPGYAPVYYPGAGSITGASRLRIDSGRHLQGIDLVLAASPMTRVSGHAFNSQGLPLAGSVFLSPSQRFGEPSVEPRQAYVRADGGFEFARVPPGEYVVKAVSGTLLTRPRQRTPAASEFGMQYMAVGDMEPPPVMLRASPGSTVEGRLTEEAPAGTSRPRIRLVPLPAEPDYTAPANVVFDRRTSIYTDGTFVVSGLFGPVRLTATLPDDWYLESVTIQGVNVADRPFDFGFRGEWFSDAEIVVSNAGASISGRIADDRGATAVGEHSVLVFSIYRDHWFPGSRHLKLGPSANDGTFDVRGLPPGDYYVAAIDAPAETMHGWHDAAVLEALMTRAQRVTLRERQRGSATLRLTRAGGGL